MMLRFVYVAIGQRTSSFLLEEVWWKLES